VRKAHVANKPPEKSMAKKSTEFTVTDGKLVLRLEPVEEGGYVVTSPFNSDILTQAETLEEAFENARDVIALFDADRKAERAKKKKAVAR